MAQFTDNTQPNTTTRPRRSIAWLYYAILAVVALIAGVGQPALLVAALPFGAYSRYLYRGGRIVIWLW